MQPQAFYCAVVAVALAAATSGAIAEPVEDLWEDGFAKCDSDEGGMCPSVSLIQKDVALATHAKSKLRSEAEAMAAYKQRAWLLCLGPTFGPRSADEAESHVERVNVMKCTEEMSFPELCCAPFAAGLNYSRVVDVDLKDGQDKVAVGKSAALLQTGDAEAVMICTEEAAAAKIAKARGAAAGMSQMTCMNTTFAAAEITGEAKDASGAAYLTPGQIVLEARINYLLKQGIPASSIPTCTKTVGTCPDGSAPASAGQEVLGGLDLTQTGRGFGGGFSLGAEGAFAMSSVQFR